ncbi:MAG: FAD-dependent thymidylate synthase [Thermoproteota archaeon]|nr:FAD-dependent thymidylate synthase [Candidatus Brockarchaeota archaeon]
MFDLMAAKIIIKQNPTVNLIDFEAKNVEMLRRVMKGKTHGGSPDAWLNLGFTVPLEFVDLTYEVYCSRVCSHQMVRHRIGTSFIQHSGRFGYYKECGNGTYTFILPRSLIKEKGNEIEGLFSEIISKYELLASSKVPLEEARRVIPESIQTFLIVKFNLRSLGSFLRQRLCSMAQPEIRYVALEMFSQLSKKFDELQIDSKLVNKYLLPPCATMGYCLNVEKANQGCLKNGLFRAIEEHAPEDKINELKSFVESFA